MWIQAPSAVIPHLARTSLVQSVTKTGLSTLFIVFLQGECANVRLCTKFRKELQTLEQKGKLWGPDQFLKSNQQPPRQLISSETTGGPGLDTVCAITNRSYQGRPVSSGTAKYQCQDWKNGKQKPRGHTVPACVWRRNPCPHQKQRHQRLNSFNPSTSS